MSHEDRDYIEQLRLHGFRVTMQRLIVLDAVCDVGGHATFAAIAVRVKDLDPTISQSTIYRTLDMLVEAELIVSSEMDSAERIYEIAGNTPHHHLVCNGCGEVQRLNHTMVESLFNHIQESKGFQVTTDHLILPGLCAKCRNENGPAQ